MILLRLDGLWHINMILIPLLLWDQFWSLETRLCQTFVRAICDVTSGARFANGACCYQPTIPLTKGTYERGDLFSKWKGETSLSSHCFFVPANVGPIAGPTMGFPHAIGKKRLSSWCFSLISINFFRSWYSKAPCQWLAGDWWLGLGGFCCGFLIGKCGLKRNLRNVYLDLAPTSRWLLKGMSMSS